MLADDLPPSSQHSPFAVRHPLDVCRPRAPMDLGAELSRPRRHRIGNIGRRHMTVGHGSECRLDVESVEKGMIALDLIGPDDLGFVACKLGDTVDIFEPVHLLLGMRKPQAPAAVPLFRKRAIRSVKSTRLIQARINVRVVAGNLDAVSRRQLSDDEGHGRRAIDPAQGSDPLEAVVYRRQVAHVDRSAWLLRDNDLAELSRCLH